MKNKTLIILSLLLSGCFGKPPVTKTGLEGKSVPPIELLLQDSTTHFNTSTIPAGKPFILYSFATWCPYCKAQTKELVNNIESFKDINIYMITTSPLEDFRKFSNEFKLHNYKNIVAGFDTQFYFANYFQTNVVPYFAIYDKDKKLNRVLLGKSSVNLIHDILSDL